MVDDNLKILQTNQALQGGANSQADDLQEIKKKIFRYTKLDYFT